MKHRSADELASGLDAILMSPSDEGQVQMIVVRPESNERKVLDECRLSQKDGLEGDRWSKAKSPNPRGQVSLMNSRCLELLSESRADWQLAGDNLIVDFDLAEDNLPPGARFQVGTAVLEATDLEHHGCRKFQGRYGKAAQEFVNSPIGAELKLRGIYARVIEDGVVQVGDKIRLLSQREDDFF